MTVEKLLRGLETGALTRNELVFALARLLTPDNMQDVISQLPADLRSELRRWAFASVDGRTLVVGSNLSSAEAQEIQTQLDRTRISFREWLEAQEREASDGKDVRPIREPAARS